MRNKSSIIGAYDLKRSYQRNVAIGFGVSGMMHVTALVTLVLCVFQAKEITVTVPNNFGRDTTIFIMPPHISRQEYTDPVKTTENKAVKEFGIPTPVPDELAPTTVEIPDQQQLSALAPDTPIENLGVGFKANIDSIVSAIIPLPDMPTFYDEPPIVVAQITPEYPKLAERAGIEGFVWIKAFINKEGKVLDVIVIKSSPPDVGFEEAAITAANQTVWKPAISNGMPIGVWITYKVEFKLK
jgi:protein TonB